MAPPAALSRADPVLEANAYAVAEDVDLSVVLRGAATEFALRDAELIPATVAGTLLPQTQCSRDLQGLLESGVPVYVEQPAALRLGLGEEDFLPGVRVVSPETIAALVRDAEAVLHW